MKLITEKTTIIALLSFALSFSSVSSQNDSLSMMNNDIVTVQEDRMRPLTPQNQGVSTFTDSRDGKVYKPVTIGTQVWMAENLAYLPSVASPDTGSQTKPYYYVYGYNGTNVTEAKATSNYAAYGVLYNWSAAMAATASSSANPNRVQGSCPSGWHLPSAEEWALLTNYLGGPQFADEKLKETGTSHWKGSNTEANNESGFTALPGGYRLINGIFAYKGFNAHWWSATECSDTNAWYKYMYYNDTYFYLGSSMKLFGFSVRCVKD